MSIVTNDEMFRNELIICFNRFIVSMFVPFSEVFILTVMEELRFDGNGTVIKVSISLSISSNYLWQWAKFLNSKSYSREVDKYQTTAIQIETRRRKYGIVAWGFGRIWQSWSSPWSTWDSASA